MVQQFSLGYDPTTVDRRTKALVHSHELHMAHWRVSLVYYWGC
jgi:hypothetical protein